MCKHLQVFSSLGDIITTEIAFTSWVTSTRNQKVLINFSKVLTACL